MKKVLIIAFLIIALFIMSPYATVVMIRAMFKGGVATTADHYDQHLENVSIREGKAYDIFTPKDSVKDTIVWIHGGAFVAGDKSDVYEYAVELAHSGYKVITIAYNRAPKGKFPTLLNEIDLTLHDLKSEIVGQLILAGDSAGAHLSLQYVIAQNNPKYFEKLQIEPFVSDQTIMKLVLFCGPYNVDRLVSQFSQAPWLYKKIAHDVKKVYVTKGSDLSLLNLTQFVPQSMPEIFISDANTLSFRADNLELVEKLKQLEIKHTAVFPEGETSHEFQFMMADKAAQDVFQALIEFLY